MTTQSPDEMQKFYDWFYENFSTREDCILTPDELDRVYKYAQKRASKSTLVLPDKRDIPHHNDNEFIQGEVYGFNLCLDKVRKLNAPTVSEGKCEPDTVWEGYLLDDNLLVRDSFNNWVETLGETEASYRIEAYKLPESGTGGE